MPEPDKALQLVTSLWHSNFRDLRIIDGGTITVSQKTFSTNAIALLVDLAQSYDLDLEFRGGLHTMKAVFAPKGML